MLSEDRIDQAIEAHTKWKREFVQAIQDGGDELTYEMVSADDRCGMGIWLQGDVAAKKSVLYERVKKLHRDLHLEAGRIFALANEGQSYEAMQAMEPNTPFARLSSSLRYALDQWRFKIRQATRGDPPKER